MKKALILAGMIAVALTACGKKEEAAAPELIEDQPQPTTALDDALGEEAQV